MFITIKYLSAQTICVNDVEKPNLTEVSLNTSQISIVTSLQDFKTPLSGRLVGKIAKVKMNSGDIFYIDEENYGSILNQLKFVKPTKY